MIAKPNRPSRAARQLALAASRASGCTCTPDIRPSPRRQFLEVAHDTSCPLAAGLTLLFLDAADWPAAG
jgi:hypothetical protein